MATAGSLPLLRTSAAPPFSTTDPSGRSEKALVAALVHCPALVAEKLQKVPLSCVQKLAAQEEVGRSTLVP
jgi:hypothetical protein